MDVHVLNRFNEDIFINFLRSQKNSNDRNASWFEELLTNYTFRKYFMWTYCTDNGKIWSMASVQTHGFPQGVYRMMSRFYVIPEYRNKHMQSIRVGNDPESAPANFMFPLQYQAVRNNYKHMIITMEQSKKRRIMPVVAKYYNRQFGTNFKFYDRMIKTFDNENDWRAWQCCVCDSRDGSDPPIKSMDYKDFDIKFKS